MTIIITQTSAINGTADPDIILATATTVNGSPSSIFGNEGSDVIFGDSGPAQPGSGAGATIPTALSVDASGFWSTAFNRDLGDDTVPHTSIVTEGSGAVQFFSVTVGAGETLVMDVDHAAGTAGSIDWDSMLTLYAPNGSFLAADDNALVTEGGLGSAALNGGAFTLDPYLSYTNTTGSAQTYYVRLSASGGTGIPAGAAAILNLSVSGHAATAVSTEYGYDYVFGGLGDDILYAVAQEYQFNGSFPDDNLAGGDGNDTLVAGLGDDSLRGEADDDTAFAFSDGSQDTFAGGSGTDTLDLSRSSQGWSTPTGGSPILASANGSRIDFSDVERFIGSGFNDILYFYTIPFQLMDLGAGSDTMLISTVTDQSTLLGGEGSDRLISFIGQDTTLDMGAFTLTDGTDTLTIRSVEFVDMGSGNDTVTGTGGQQTISGGGGDDLIEARGGNDYLFLSDGRDSIFGQGGDDFISGFDRLFEAGQILDGGGGFDTLFISGQQYSFNRALDDVTYASIETLEIGRSFATVEEMLFRVSDFVGAGGLANAAVTITGQGGLRLGFGLDGQSAFFGHLFAADFTGGPLASDELFVVGTDAAETIGAFDHATMITGNGGADLLLGRAGDDTLFGDRNIDELPALLDLNPGSTTSQRLEVPVMTGMPTSTMTLEFLMQSPGFNLASGTCIVSYAVSGSTNEFSIFTSPTGTMRVIVNGLAVDTTVPAASVFDGELHRISVVWDSFALNDTLAFYVDGMLEWSGSTAGTVAGNSISTDGYLMLGQDQDGSTPGPSASLDPAQAFHGSLGDIRIFRDVRSDAEIADYAFTGLPDFDFDLGAYWQVDPLTGEMSNPRGPAMASVGTLAVVQPVQPGSADDDTLDGGAGADRMVGGDGDDTYFFDNVGDTAEETPSGGTDRVFSSVTTTLLTSAPNVEELFLEGAGSIGFGNMLNNVIRANPGIASLVNGLGGNDTLLARNAADTLIGGDGDDRYDLTGLAPAQLAGPQILEGPGGGSDTVIVQNGSFSLQGLTHVENLTALGGGNNVLTGNAGANAITGAGAATLFGRAGNDTLTGGTGGNLINGEEGDDILNGGDGDDTLAGGAGDDEINGGAGLDIVSYFGALTDMSISLPFAVSGEGADSLSSIEGAYGSNIGNDTIDGDTGGNYLHGFGGNDTIDGGGGADTILGGAGDDVLTVDVAGTHSGATGLMNGQNGNDSLEGSDGNDTLLGGAGNDTLTGGAGTDTLSYLFATGGVTVNLSLATPQAVGGGEGTDVFSGFEGLVGSDFGDVLFGSDADNLVFGGSGDDRLYGGLGNDTLDGGAGVDAANYFFASGGVTVDLGAATQDNSGVGQGVDTLLFVENILGSASGSDVLTGNAVANRIAGYGGADLVDGLAGNDTLFGGGGSDTLRGGTEDDQLLGGAGNDLLLGQDGADTLNGGAGDDTLFGGNGADVLFGDAGADALFGGAAADRFLYTAASQSQVSARDVLTGFVSGQDIVDLGMIDANSTAAGNQAFAFIGGAGFSAAGQLRFVTNGTDGFLLGDVDGNGVADLNIQLAGVTALAVSDVVL